MRNEEHIDIIQNSKGDIQLLSVRDREGCGDP